MSDRAVVADATVLIFLGKLRRLETLRDQYETILVPGAVYTEVVERGTEVGATDAVRVENAIEAGWITVCDASRRPEIENFDLEAGETEVLSLALERGHDEVLADEESVREVARLFDLRPRGTLFFLFSAVDDGSLTFDEFLEQLDRLIDAGFYLDEAVYLEAIRKARSLSDETE